MYIVRVCIGICRCICICSCDYVHMHFGTFALTYRKQRRCRDQLGQLKVKSSIRSTPSALGEGSVRTFDGKQLKSVTLKALLTVVCTGNPSYLDCLDPRMHMYIYIDDNMFINVNKYAPNM